MKLYFLLVLLFGLAIRLILVGSPGFVADISFWKSWGLAAYDHGIVWTTENTNINYPPGFIYILWLMTKIYTLFGNPHDYNSFWRENNFGFLLASKSIAIVADVAIAVLIYWFFSQKEKLKQLGANSPLTTHHSPLTTNLPLLLASVFFLNPVVILDSGLWGQVESFGLAFTLIAVILLFYNRPYLAAFIFTIGPLMKLQNIIFTPLFFLFVLRYFDIKVFLKTLAVATATFFLVNLPFLVKNEMSQVLYLLTVNSDYFPFLSLNAHNLWWIVAKADGMSISDKITVLGILNAKTLGLIIFSSLYLLSFILLFLKPIPRNLYLVLTLSIFAFFLFSTQSHERYSYPVVVLLLFLYPFLEKAKYRITNYFWVVYSLLSLAIFFNLHHGLILNYPENGFYPLTRISTPQLSILNSYFLILLFFLLLPFVFSQISIFFFVLSSSFLVLGLFLLNFSYLVKGQVSLTSFKPVLIKQDYGSLQVNKAVNSFQGWKNWNRLSNNYFYYRKGFGTHANSNIVFDIDKKFTVLATDYGIDTEAGTPATVVFKIYGDGRQLYQSKVMGRFDFPEHVKVDVSGVKHLGLTVEDAGDGINHDHADWYNPVLYK